MTAGTDAPITLPSLTEALADGLPRQRWFPGKGREITGVDIESSVDLATEPAEVRLVVARITYGDGESERFQLPLALRRGEVDDEQQRVADPGSYGVVDDDGPALAYDALVDPELTTVWLQALADGREVGDIRFERREELIVEPGRLLGVEQSNSSVVYGDRYILKIYRRLQEGLNPDLEVVRALTEAGSSHVAPVLGWIETADGTDTTLGLLQPFYRSGTDGWVSAVASVRDLFAEADLHADEVGGDFAAESCRIGGVVASLHADLARALPTAEYGSDRHAALADTLRERLRLAVAVVPELAERRDPIDAVYDELAKLAQDVPVQRVHGDLHLGQLLRVDTGWLVLDFEGEPARSLPDRTMLMSPLRDVAGMLRSFDYAPRHLLAEQPGRNDLEYRAVEWAERNRNAFCQGYADVTGRDPRDDAVLLRAFELDKAVYETVYEARNRPSWLPIPLSGIDRIIGESGTTGESSG